jgi:hypothetical protein
VSAPYFKVVLRRGLGFWLGTRLLLTALSMAAGGGLALAPPAAVGLVALVTWLVWLDARTANESVLVANLGISQLQNSALVAALTGTIETCVMVASRLAG